MSCTDGLVNMDFDGSLANKIDYQIVTFVHEKQLVKKKSENPIPKVSFFKRGCFLLSGVDNNELIVTKSISSVTVY